MVTTVRSERRVKGAVPEVQRMVEAPMQGGQRGSWYESRTAFVEQSVCCAVLLDVRMDDCQRIGGGL